MLVLFYGAGISFILLVGRPIPPTWIKEFVRVFLCPEFKMNLSLKIQMMKNAIIFAKCHSIAELLQKNIIAYSADTDRLFLRKRGRIATRSSGNHHAKYGRRL